MLSDGPSAFERMILGSASRVPQLENTSAAMSLFPTNNMILVHFRVQVRIDTPNGCFQTAARVSSAFLGDAVASQK
jgi:hypothetical protein